MAVRGSTPEARREARGAQRAQRRLDHFIHEIRGATTGRQRLQQACQFAKAVANDLDDDARTDMAREIAEIADRRNRT
jgi:hypothetical protein